MKKLYFFSLLFIFPALSLSAQDLGELQDRLVSNVEQHSHADYEQYLSFARDMEITGETVKIGDWELSEEEQEHLMVMEKFLSFMSFIYALDLSKVVEVKVEQLTKEEGTYHEVILQLGPSSAGTKISHGMDGDMATDTFDLLYITLGDYPEAAEAIKNDFLVLATHHGAKVKDGGMVKK